MNNTKRELKNKTKTENVNKTKREPINKTKREPMNKTLKYVLISSAALVTTIILILVSYVIYVFAAYYRIDDNLEITWDERSDKVISSSGKFTAVSYNIGFGAYSPDFTFFMDGGKESVARSKEAVESNTKGAIDLVKTFKPDFTLIQETDIDSTRSYHVNQDTMFASAFPDYEHTFAMNYDSPFLMYPIAKPHGKSKAGLNTMSKYSFTQSTRRSLPITKSVSKLFDLDRCYSVNKFAMDNGKSFYVYNVHLSAYGGSPEIREAQVDMLFNDIKDKMDNGDYVICGGDYNHDMTDATQNLGNGNAVGNFEWAQPFPFDKMPSGVSFARNYVDKNVPSARNCDIAYEKGKTMVFVLDGFFVSNNVEVVKVQNYDGSFAYSDHNPVVMNFRFK